MKSLDFIAHKNRKNAANLMTVFIIKIAIYHTKYLLRAEC